MRGSLIAEGLPTEAGVGSVRTPSPIALVVRIVHLGNNRERLIKCHATGT